MDYGSLLAMHIAFACATGVVALVSLTVVAARLHVRYRSAAIVLAALASLTIGSGVMLSLLTPVTALSLCRNIAVYLTVVCFVEFILFLRMRTVPIDYPTRTIIGPIGAALIMLAGGIALGV